MLLLAANGDDSDEFAGLVEAMFEIDEPLSRLWPVGERL